MHSFLVICCAVALRVTTHEIIVSQKRVLLFVPLTKSMCASCKKHVFLFVSPQTKFVCVAKNMYFFSPIHRINVLQETRPYIRFTTDET
jgi:hypothetical protein